MNKDNNLPALPPQQISFVLPHDIYDDEVKALYLVVMAIECSWNPVKLNDAEKDRVVRYLFNRYSIKK